MNFMKQTAYVSCWPASESTSGESREAMGGTCKIQKDGASRRPPFY
jgi:hypothetical protein